MWAITVLEFEAGRLRRALVNVIGIEGIEKMVREQLNDVERALGTLKAAEPAEPEGHSVSKTI